MIALTNKLTGNSLYSASLLNKEKHRNITYIPFGGNSQQNYQRSSFRSFG